MDWALIELNMAQLAAQTLQAKLPLPCCQWSYGWDASYMTVKAMNEDLDKLRYAPVHHGESERDNTTQLVMESWTALDTDKNIQIFSKENIYIYSFSVCVFFLPF